jgi:hypothetical protein
MKDLGPCRSFLGVRIVRNRKEHTIHLAQDQYIGKVVQAFGLLNAKDIIAPMEVSAVNSLVPYEQEASGPEIKEYQHGIGSLMHAMVQTRPDLSFTVGSLARFSHNPSPTHMKALNRCIRYLKTTQALGITYGKPESVNYHGYSDSDFAGDITTQKSTSGYVFIMAGGPVSWKSARQHAVTLSSTEAEYYALTEAAKEAIWQQAFLGELGYTGKDRNPVLILGDNTGALALAENPELHQRCKHIDIKQHFIRQEVEKGTITLGYKPTDQMIADGLTKPLSTVKHKNFVKQLGMEAINGN